MQPAALRRKQVVVDRLGQEGVPEPVGVGSRLGLAYHDLAGQRLAEGRLQVGLGCPGYRREQVGGHPPPGDSGDAQDALRLFGQGGHPAQEDVAQRLGNAIRVRFGARCEQFLDEERVALGPPGDAVDEPRRRDVLEDCRDELVQLIPPEPGQLYPPDPGQALHLGQPQAEGMPAVELVRPVRADHREPLRARIAGKERGHVPGRSVGPVEVFEDQHDRHPLAERLEQGEQPLEDPRLDPLWTIVRRGIRQAGAQLRHEPAELRRARGAQLVDRAEPGRIVRHDGHEATKGLDDRRERQLPPSPRATHPPSRTSIPAWFARLAISVTSRVLPIPASPPIRRRSACRRRPAGSRSSRRTSAVLVRRRVAA